MGTRMIRDRSKDGNWWFLVGLFTLCVVGWSAAFSFKAGAADRVSGGDPDKAWSVSEFSKIRISGNPDVTLVQGEREGVTGEGDPDDLDRLEIYVDEDELVIKPTRDGWFGNWDMDDVHLTVELQSLDRLAVSGAAELDAESLQSSDLNVVISGSSDISIEDLRGDRLALTVSGSADVEIAGSVADQNVQISGSADYEALDLSSDSARVRISGSGDAEISVAVTLEARVSGSGTVRYRGEPAVESHVSGSGEIGPVR